MAPQLFEQVKLAIQQHVSVLLNELRNSLVGQESGLLERLSALWIEYCEQIKTIRTIFLYLDRSFVFQQLSIKSIWLLGLEIFANEIREKQNDVLLSKCVGLSLDLIERERKAEAVNQSVLRNVIRMLSAVHLYAVAFEPAFLQASQSFYEREGQVMVERVSVPQFLAHINKRLAEEVC